MGNSKIYCSEFDKLDHSSNIYALLTKRVVKMAGYWPIASSFLRFYGPRRSRGP